MEQELAVISWVLRVKPWRRRRLGLTLIELLVVVTIISILAALLLPALEAARARAWSVKCKGNLHQMGLALNMYLADFHAYPAWNTPAPANGFYRHWSRALQPYSFMDWTNANSHCPGYKGAIVETLDGEACWGSYGYNRWGVSSRTSGGPPLGLDGLNNVTNGLWTGTAVREASVLVPSDMFAIMDARGILMGKLQAGIDWTYCVPWSLAFPSLMQPPQHATSFNVLYCDAHTASLKLSDLFDPTKTGLNWNNDHRSHPEVWASPSIN